MADTVLESFLIKLSYQIDQSSQKNFMTSVANAIESVTKFSAALVAMAVAVEEAVRRTAAQMARLETTAQLAGRSASALKALGTAGEAVGIGYESIIQQQVKLNTLFVESPWMKDYARQRLDGHAATIENIMRKYAELSKTNKEAALSFRWEMEENLGISGETFTLYEKNAATFEQILKRQQEEAERLQKSQAIAAENAVKLRANFASLTTTIDTMYKSAFGGLTGLLNEATSGVQEWLISNQKAFDDWVVDFDGKLAAHDWKGAGQKIGEAIGAGVKYFFDHIFEWISIGVKAAGEFLRGFADGLIKEEGVLGAAATVIGGIFVSKMLLGLVGSASRGIFSFLFGGASAAAGTAGAAAGSVFGKAFKLAGWMFIAEMIHQAWKQGVGGKDYDPEKAKEGGGLIGGMLSDLGLGDAVHAATKEHKGILEGGSFGDTPPGQFLNWLVGGGRGANDNKPPGGLHGGIVPSFALGGVVNANLHAGEMVLPKTISDGLQKLYGGGDDDVVSLSQDVYDELQTVLNEAFYDLDHWLNSDSGFMPLVTFGQEVYDKLEDAIEEAMLRVFPERDTRGGGTGGGGDGAAAGGAGGGGGGGGGADGAAADGGAPGGPGPASGLLSQKALEAIAKGEGTLKKGAIDYNTVYGGKHVDLASMTINQVMEMQKEMIAKQGHSPVGAFQITRDTVAGLVKQLKLDPATAMMTPEIQQQMATQLYKTRGLQPWSNPSTRGGTTQREFEELKRGGGLYSTGAESGTPSQVSELGGAGKTGRFGKGSDAALLDIMQHAFKAALPEGYRAEQTSGERTRDPRSGHYGGHAGDFQIYDASGKALRNRGQADSEMYRRTAVQAYLYTMQKYGPEMAKKLGWGGHFGTAIGGGGEADTMHFDWMFKGIRGRIGNTMAEYNQALKMFQAQKEQIAHTVKSDTVVTPSQLKAGGGAQLTRPQQNVDNSVNTTVIHGVTDPHGVQRVTADLGNRNDAHRKRHQRTFVA